MTTILKKRKITKRHLDKKLIFLTRLFIGIFIIMVGILAYDIFRGRIGFSLALGGLLTGVATGLIFGRMVHIKWHEDSRKVVAKMDTIGVFVLVFYITFSIFRRQIFGHFVQGSVFTAFTFSMVGGGMLGRVFYNIRNIRKILTIQDIIG